VAVSQNIGGKQLDRTYTFDRVRAARGRGAAACARRRVGR
jgi:hypothetical protein